MFPTANSVVHYNEDGEPTGWDTYHDDAPEFDDFYRDYADEPDLYDPEDCDHDNVGSILHRYDGEHGICDDCESDLYRQGCDGPWSLA